MNTKEINDKFVVSSYGRAPLVLVEGKGVRVKDDEGKSYIDLGSGIGVNSFGYCDEKWVEAVSAQAVKLQHTSNIFYTEPSARLAKLICEKSGMSKVFFSNSGAEANECAIKAARAYAAGKKGSDCYKIITLVNSFHGRTITTLAATGQEVFHKDFLPLTDGFLYAEANNIEGLKKLVNENKIAAIMFELVQGESGVNPLTKEFVDAMTEIAEKEDIILIDDEVQIGNGRSGEVYAFMNYGFVPDIASTAKGIAGGLPMGVTMFNDKTKDIFKPGMHGSTFGANPVSCAGALSVLERIDEDFLASVREKSEFVFKTLTGKPGVEGVYGLGLMIGIKTVKPADEVLCACRDKGVLVLKAKDRVRLLPPLSITMDELKEALDILISVL